MSEKTPAELRSQFAAEHYERRNDFVKMLTRASFVAVFAFLAASVSVGDLPTLLRHSALASLLALIAAHLLR